MFKKAENREVYSQNLGLPLGVAGLGVVGTVELSVVPSASVVPCSDVVCPSGLVLPPWVVSGSEVDGAAVVSSLLLLGPALVGAGIFKGIFVKE